MIYRILRWLGLWPDADSEKKLESMLCAFDTMMDSMPFSYTSVSDYNRIVCFCDEILLLIRHVRLPKYHPLYKEILAFEAKKEQLKEIVERNNELYIASEMERCKALLSDIHGKFLDPQQRKAVVTDADRNLIIAGAGSGKTLTIEAKVKYLCEEKGIAPEEILLISYTKKRVKRSIS